MSNLATVENSPVVAFPVVDQKQPIALRAIMDESLSSRIETAAVRMSKATGITPPHLLGQPETCFDVVCLALDTGLAPGFIAKSTFPIESNYKDDDGKWHRRLSIGYESKLMRALMQTSGLFSHIEEELVGDWSKVQGKWKWGKSAKGKDLQTKTYTENDEVGLSVKIRVILAKDNREVEWSMDLRNMWPRNSTLWATDPATQARYAALRRFCNLRYPSVLGGATFEDDYIPAGPEHARDVTPPKPAAAPAEPAMVVLYDQHGSECQVAPVEVETWWKDRVDETTSAEEMRTLVENNANVPQWVQDLLPANAEVEPEMELEPHYPLISKGAFPALDWMTECRRELNRLIPDEIQYWDLLNICAKIGESLPKNSDEQIKARELWQEIKARLKGEEV